MRVPDSAAARATVLYVAPRSTDARWPVDVEEPIVVSAAVDERNGRRLQISGELSVDGETRVKGSGLYLVVSILEEMLDGHRDA